MKYTVAFPGRDAFYKGLDKGFYDRFDIIRKTFEEASEYLGEDLYHISYIKPEIKAELHTACLITHCFGVYEAVKAYLKPPSGIVGFSHGEFTANAGVYAENRYLLRKLYDIDSASGDGAVRANVRTGQDY